MYINAQQELMELTDESNQQTISKHISHMFLISRQKSLCFSIYIPVLLGSSDYLLYWIPCFHSSGKSLGKLCHSCRNNIKLSGTSNKIPFISNVVCLFFFFFSQHKTDNLGQMCYNIDLQKSGLPVELGKNILFSEAGNVGQGK